MVLIYRRAPILRKSCAAAGGPRLTFLASRSGKYELELSARRGGGVEPGMKNIPTKGREFLRLADCQPASFLGRFRASEMAPSSGGLRISAPSSAWGIVRSGIGPQAETAAYGSCQGKGAQQLRPKDGGKGSDPALGGGKTVNPL